MAAFIVLVMAFVLVSACTRSVQQQNAPANQQSPQVNQQQASPDQTVANYPPQDQIDNSSIVVDSGDPGNLDDLNVSDELPQ